MVDEKTGLRRRECAIAGDSYKKPTMELGFESYSCFRFCLSDRKEGEELSKSSPSRVYHPPYLSYAAPFLIFSLLLATRARPYGPIHEGDVLS
jgi:hypothetical protein